MLLTKARYRSYYERMSVESSSGSSARRTISTAPCGTGPLRSELAYNVQSMVTVTTRDPPYVRPRECHP